MKLKEELLLNKRSSRVRNSTYSTLPAQILPGMFEEDSQPKITKGYDRFVYLLYGNVGDWHFSLNPYVNTILLGLN